VTAKHRNSGQALVEYLIVCSALAVALFYPFADGEAVAVLLARALSDYFLGLSFVMSII
jgi:Na+-transporting NADH:ubiquinone oxidoreductase subunit NqrD